jgi:hypothetical protein
MNLQIREIRKLKTANNTTESSEKIRIIRTSYAGSKLSVFGEINVQTFNPYHSLVALKSNGRWCGPVFEWGDRLEQNWPGVFGAITLQ